MSYIQYKDSYVGLFTEEEAIKHMNVFADMKRIEGCKVESNSPYSLNIDDEDDVYIHNGEVRDEGKITTLLVDNGPNGVDHLGFNSADSAMDYIFSRITLYEDPQDVWSPWIEENKDGLWLHYGELFKYSDDDRLFNMKKYPDAPKTIPELRKWLSDGKEFHIGWGDSIGSNKIRIHKLKY